MYFLMYLCVYIFTRVFHECLSRGICVQRAGFPRMKHACNAAIPVACTVRVQVKSYFFTNYFLEIYSYLTWNVGTESYLPMTTLIISKLYFLPITTMKHETKKLPCCSYQCHITRSIWVQYTTYIMYLP